MIALFTGLTGSCIVLSALVIWLLWRVDDLESRLDALGAARGTAPCLPPIKPATPIPAPPSGVMERGRRP